MVWAMGRWLPQPGIAGSSAVPHLARLQVRTRGALSVALVSSAVSVVTVSNRFGPLPLRDVAASERAVGEGRVWLLVSSAFVADRPAVASVAGLVIVGLAALAFCGARLLWAAAAFGHIGGTVVVYAALALARTVDVPFARHAMGSADYGTSAIIAAWIGVIAYSVWRRGSGAAALALCVVSGLVGWFFRPDLDVLDSEHMVAFAFGMGLASIAAGAGAASGAGAVAASLRRVWPGRARSRAAGSPA